MDQTLFAPTLKTPSVPLPHSSRTSQTLPSTRDVEARGFWSHRFHLLSIAPAFASAFKHRFRLHLHPLKRRPDRTLLSISSHVASKLSLSRTAPSSSRSSASGLHSSISSFPRATQRTFSQLRRCPFFFCESTPRRTRRRKPIVFDFFFIVFPNRFVDTTPSTTMTTTIPSTAMIT